MMRLKTPRSRMARRSLLSTFTLLGALLAAVSIGTKALAGERLRLRSGDVDLTDPSQATNVLSLPHFSTIQDDERISLSLGRPAWVGTKEKRPSKKADARTIRHFVVQMNDRIANEDLINFKSLKLQVIRYLPDDAVVFASTARAAQVLAKSSNRIRAISFYHPDWKLAPELGASSVFSNDPVILTAVRLFPDQDVKTVASKLKNSKVKVKATSDGVLVLESKRSMIQPLASLDAVEWIEPLSTTEKEPSASKFGPAWLRALTDSGVASASRSPASADEVLESMTQDSFAKAYRGGVRVNSSVWNSSAASGIYDSAAQQADDFVHANPDFLILFSPGAAGDGSGKLASIDPNSVATFGSAKNALTAGSNVAEVASVVRDYLTKNRKISDPSAAIMKAVLLHTSDDLFAGLFVASGSYRRVDAAKATSLASSLLVDERVGLGPNETHLYPITLSKRTQLSATLAYSDASAAAAASMALVNDLDLAIIDSDGKRWELGDHGSNAEHLSVNLPAGTYRIEVRGANVPLAKQPYALVVSAAI